MSTIDVIRDAFRDRVVPDVLIESKEISPEEYREVMAFDKRHWSSLTCEELDSYHDVIFLFSPTAFECAAGVFHFSGGAVAHQI